MCELGAVLRRMHAQHRQCGLAPCLGDRRRLVVRRGGHRGVGEDEVPDRRFFIGLDLLARGREDLVVGDLGRDRAADQIAGIRRLEEGPVGGKPGEPVPEWPTLDTAVLVAAGRAKPEHGLEIIERGAPHVELVVRPAFQGPHERRTHQGEQRLGVLGRDGGGERRAHGVEGGVGLEQFGDLHLDFGIGRLLDRHCGFDRQQAERRHAGAQNQGG